ncbi:hypothetical protein C3V36_03510 [Lachnospiraceae bacterium oral taxon 500]|nr:hypothetical protein C3V36_03510 [Lachnospiraceae bacterium oral taxon 500]
MIFSFIGYYSPADQRLRLKAFAAVFLRRRILLRKTDRLSVKRRKMNMPALWSHSFVLARFTFRFAGCYFLLKFSLNFHKLRTTSNFFFAKIVVESKMF